MADGDTPWWGGFDDESKTWVQSSGWDKLEAPAAAEKAVKSYRELQKLHGGLAAGDVIKLPRPDDADGLKAFWQKVGAPASADDYTIKNTLTDGTGIDDWLQRGLKEAAATSMMPKGMLAAFVEHLIPHIEKAAAEDALSDQVDAAENTRALEQSWGSQTARNKFIAAKAMTDLQVPTEAVQALEKAFGGDKNGYLATMNHFLKLGEAMGEARWVPSGGNSGELTADQAKDQLARLSNDDAWVKRWRNGGVEEAAQKLKLIKIIAEGMRNGR